MTRPRKVNKPLTRADARKAIRWFQARMGLQDWTLRIWVKDEPPAWRAGSSTQAVGGVRWWVSDKSANIWVSPARCKTEGADDLLTLFHEGMHVVGADVGFEDGELNERLEFSWDRVSGLMADAYRAGL